MKFVESVRKGRVGVGLVGQRHGRERSKCLLDRIQFLDALLNFFVLCHVVSQSNIRQTRQSSSQLRFQGLSFLRHIFWKEP